MKKCSQTKNNWINWELLTGFDPVTNINQVTIAKEMMILMGFNKGYYKEDGKM